MHRRFLTLAPTVLGVVIAIPAHAQTWQIDPAHSAAHFKVRHMMVSNVRGDFQKLTGAVTFDGKDLSTLSVEAVIDATSVDTREEKRDTHLKSADFLDVANHPTITFKSKRAESAGADRMKVVGDLTIRGVTKEVVLDVEGPTPAIKDQRGMSRVGATATTTINRKDFGVNWNRALDAGGVVVSDDVEITIDLELISQSTSSN